MLILCINNLFFNLFNYLMTDSRNSQLFLKFLHSKCANITSEIESLLREVCNWVSNAEEQARTARAGRGWHDARHTPDHALQTAHINNHSLATVVPKAYAPLRKSLQSPKNCIPRNHQINSTPNISCKKEDENQDYDDDYAIAQINQDHDTYKNKDSLAMNKTIKKSLAKDIQPKKIIISSIQNDKNSDSKFTSEDKIKHSKFSTSLLDHLKSLENLDFDPTNLRHIY